MSSESSTSSTQPNPKAELAREQLRQEFREGVKRQFNLEQVEKVLALMRSRSFKLWLDWVGNLEHKFYRDLRRAKSHDQTLYAQGGIETLERIVNSEGDWENIRKILMEESDAPKNA